ncbi:hypothetical protein Droror1_Dr00012097, partial [Drosera rotundifolia]
MLVRSTVPGASAADSSCSDNPPAVVVSAASTAAYSADDDSVAGSSVAGLILYLVVGPGGISFGLAALDFLLIGSLCSLMNCWIIASFWGLP